MNNNYTADGSGRDWVIFGDPGYHGGRQTPTAPDARMPPQGDRPVLKPRAILGTIDGRRELRGSKPEVPGGPVPEVLKRWKRANSAPTANDTAAHKRVGSDELRYLLPTMERDAAARLDSKFKPNLSCHPCTEPPMPVDKYHYFAERRVVEMQRPAGDPVPRLA